MKESQIIVVKVAIDEIGEERGDLLEIDARMDAGKETELVDKMSAGVGDRF